MISLLFALVAGPGSIPADIQAVWHNPANSVAVRIEPCGPALCGAVVRASEKARADATKGGVDHLIGTVLLRDYTPSGKDKWSGQLFVPDMGRTVGSTMQAVDRRTIRIRGCVIGGLICKSQLWTRE